MDEDFIKKMLTALGVDHSKLSPDQFKAASAATAGSSATPKTSVDPETRKAVNDAIKSSLSNKNSEAGKIDSVEARIARRDANTPKRMVTSQTQPVDNTEARIRREEYKKAGLTDISEENRDQRDLDKLDTKAAAIGKTRAEYEAMSPLDRMKLESAPAQQEAANREALREGVKATNSDLIKNNLAEGKSALAGMQSPKDLYNARIKEGWTPTAAQQVAGQQQRDMFGLQGAQGDVVRGAAPENRMNVLDQLKEGRSENLRGLTEARLKNPLRQEIGTVTGVQSSDGTQLAKRVGEEEGVGVAKSGTAGALGSTADGAGRMELTDAGRKAVENRTYTSKVDASGATTKPGSEGGLTVVAGKYGTAAGGKMNFPEALTDKQRLGEEPLSEANQKYKDSFLANARGSALNEGKVDSTAANLMQIDPTAAAKSPIAANTPDKSKEEDAIKKGLMANNKDQMAALEEELRKRKEQEA